MAIPYVPVVNNDSYKSPEKMFTLESVGMATDSEGFLKIEDPDLFTKTLGLRHSPESIMESGLKGFKDFDQFNRFLEKSVSDGLAFKDPSFYSNLQSEDFGLLRDYSKSTEAFKTDSSTSENINKALGLDTQKGEPSDAKVEVKDGMVFEKPGLDLDAPAPVESEGNPYLFGTEGNQSQIANLSDIGNGKVAMPNRSDRRSMARFNNDVKSKEFALNASQRKARELESLEKGRRDKVSLTEPAMKQWIKANPKSRAAKLALDADGNVDLSKISDTEKIQFTKNLNLGNIDFFNKPEAPVNKGVPIFDEDGLIGFENTKKFEEDMGDQQFRENPNQPNSIQKRERKDKAMLDDIRGEIKETGKHPFGEGTVLGTDYARELELRDQMDEIDFGGLKKSARDFRDHAARDVRDNTQGVDLPSPMPANYSTSKETFKPSQKMVSQDMLDRNNQEVNSVLDSVPFPRPKSPAAPRPKPRNPVTTLPFSLEQPVSKEPGVELTRTSKEYPTMDAPKYPSSNQPGMELTRTSPERPTMDVPAAQYRKQTPGFGRSGKKQINIPQLDRLDPDNYDYRPNAPKHPGGSGMGRSGKKQYNIPALDFLDLDNYFYNQ